MDTRTAPVAVDQANLRVTALPHRIDRHVIIEILGQGGMGVVYSAFDPDLGRRLAIKVLHHHGEDGRGRLLREAKALARLSHPHVIQIYDVGTYRDRVYVAMELVEGHTLRSWRSQTEPSWTEIRQMFLKAGRGLAAAHAAGLVHRDFKPDNVLIGDDGRVRVADFGLAFEPDERLVSTSGEGLRTLESSDVLDARSGRLTETGALLGTPAYMAPEQWLGRRVDMRTDQFAFCVSLYEALVGHRPFTADARSELARRVCQEDYEPLPSHLPAWLRQIVRRGLRSSPDLRYPDMPALLEELAYDPGARRRWLVGGAVGLALTAGGVGLGAHIGTDDDPCAATAEAMHDTWNEERRDQIGAAVDATALPYASPTWHGVEGRLDDYARRWRDARVDACAATRVRHEQSEATLDLRMACLDQRRQALDALVEVAMDADERLVARLPAMYGSLPELSDCEDAEALARHATGAIDPSRRDEHAAWRAKLARVVADYHAARYDDAEQAAEALAESLEPGAWPHLRIELDYWRAMIHTDRNELRESVSLMNRAYLSAVSHGHDLVAMRSSRMLASTLAEVEGRIDEAMPAWERAEAEWSRAGRDPRERTHLLNARASTEHHLGQYDRALQTLEEAVQSARDHGQDEDPNFAGLLGNLGAVASMVGDLPRAETYVREALEIRERDQGPQHPDTARDIHNLAVMIAMQDQPERAEPLFERAYALQVELFGERHPDVALSLLALGNVARAQGHDQRAEAHYLRTLELQRELLGARHADVHLPLFNLGELMLDRGQPARAIPRLREAVGLLEGALSSEHPDLELPLMRWGQALLLTGEPSEALVHLEHGHRIAQGHGEVDLELRYWLARARGEFEDQHAPARREMLLLQERLTHAPPPWVRGDLLDMVRSWLDAHDSEE